MSSNYNFSKITPDIVSLSELCRKNDGIDPELYTKYDVKRGLRDLNGKGVLAGLTEISDIISSNKNLFSVPILLYSILDA